MTRPVTIRISDEVADYRDIMCAVTRRKKFEFDQEVYEEYRRNHPVPDHEQTRKEPND